MSLTQGSGPFGPRPGGVFNFEYDSPEHVIYVEDCPKRVRSVFNGETLADSRCVKLLHETDHLPVYYFPESDVRQDLLVPSRKVTTCPYKGQAAYWTVEAGGRRALDAVWGYPEPREPLGLLAGYRALRWGAMDGWLEEDEKVYGHPRDPYHRVDVLRSERRVRIRLEGVILAQSAHPLMVFETGLPPRYYFPWNDVSQDRLEASDTRTLCPYKGEAAYYSVRLDDHVAPDVMWYYADPHPGLEKVAEHLCFDEAQVEVEVEG
jgi:uncharacterized protein (DUF427 family)